jgi:hypothetical protein
MGRTVSRGVRGFATPIGSFPNVDVTTGTTAVSNKVYWCNTTSAAFTLTLPAIPVKGDIIRVVDVANTFDTNNLTIGRSGNPIMGTAEDLTVNTEGAAFDLVYYDQTQGWRIFTI